MSSSSEKEAVRALPLGLHAVIVELGAHVGEDTRWLRLLGKGKSIHLAVEPDPVNAALFRREHPDVCLFEGVICAERGTERGNAMFYPAVNHASDNRASGSIKKPTGHLKHFPEVEFQPAIEVPCSSLDTLCHHLRHIDLIWCDIQGAERDMIQGGQKTLARTRFMMIEAEPEVELYEGQALKDELLGMLPGWEVIQDFQYNLLMRNANA